MAAPHLLGFLIACSSALPTSKTPQPQICSLTQECLDAFCFPASLEANPPQTSHQRSSVDTRSLVYGTSFLEHCTSPLYDSMPIKPGDILAGVPGQVPTMISDGKRMRVLWSEGHGDGDPSTYLIERNANTLAGHPTWKLFCGEIPETIARDKNEPPRYVYLDDRACYEIWKSKKYSREEQKAFWPFDFDYIGNIKTARTNKGRPAYVDDSCTQYATGTLRDKKKLYVFSGAPDYTPIRSIKEAAIHSKIKTETKSGDNDIEGVAVGVSAQGLPNATSSKATTLSATSSSATSSNATNFNATNSNATSLHAISSHATSPSLVSGDNDSPLHSTYSYPSSVASPVDESVVLFGMAPMASSRSAATYKSGSDAEGGEMATAPGGAKRKRKIEIEGIPFGKRTKW